MINRCFMAFGFAAILSFLFTPLAGKLAHRIGAIDDPKSAERRVHEKPTPRLGGVAIFIGAIASMLAFSKIGNTKLLGMILGSLVLVIMGTVDDTRPLPAKFKLLVQVGAAFILVGFGYRITFFTNFFGDFIGRSELIHLNGDWISIIITVIWIVGITNTVNLIDGLDGLATGVTTIASLTLAYIAYSNGSYEAMVIVLIISGACVGFLPYNFNPASIFMGDAGAYFLGFILSAVSIEGVLKGATMMTLFVPVLVLGLPIFDTAFAIVRRKINGKPIMEADRGHLHHRLLDIGLGKKRAVFVLYAISLLMGLSAIAFVKDDIMNMSVLMLFIMVMLYVPISRSISIKKDEKDVN